MNRTSSKSQSDERREHSYPHAPRRVQPPQREGITLDRLLRFIFWSAVLAACLWVLWYFLGLFVYLAIGGLIAYFLQPLVDRLRGVGVGKMPAIFITFLLFFGGLFLLIAWMAPYVLTQLTDLSQQVSLAAMAETVRSVERRLVEVLPFLQEGALIQSLENISQTLFQEGRITGTVTSVVGLFTHLVYAGLAIPFIAFFFLKDGTYLRHQVLRLVPNRYFEISLAIIDKVEVSIGRYLRALFIQCSLVALVASVLLYLVGLNYAVVVGIFVGLANSIPYFGPLVGFIAGSIVGIVQTGDFSMVLPVLIAMALTQASDNIFFQPLIFSKAAQAHPLVILFVVLIGAQLGGIVGMLVAIPVATVLRVLIEQVIWSLRNYRALKNA